MPEPSHSARLRPAPIDCRHRLLLDPYLCVGPGCEAHADTLFGIVQRAAALGIMLCVERDAWLEASRDPDVLRRRLDLSRFEPLVKLEPLPLPLPGGQDVGLRHLQAGSETDVADLKLLGALHARAADQLVALDGRLHRLAADAGLGARILTPAEALAWLEALAGDAHPLTLRELDPAAALSRPAVLDLILSECGPSDRYLLQRLEGGRGRVLVVLHEEEPLAVGVLETPSGEHSLAMVALAAAETARGARVLEPLVSAALTIARRRAVSLEALLPPHEETVLLLLERLGFRRAGADPHGRERLQHAATPIVPSLDEGLAAWVMPLDAAAHDRLLPELAGAPQAQLFAVGAGSRLQAAGGTLRKQLLLRPRDDEPVAGDLLLTFHGRAARRPASSSITAVARVEHVTRCTLLEDVLERNAPRPGASLAEIRALLENGAVTVLDVTLAGRLERFLPLEWLKEYGVLRAAPRSLRRLDEAGWEALAPRLTLA